MLSVISFSVFFAITIYTLIKLTKHWTTLDRMHRSDDQIGRIDEASMKDSKFSMVKLLASLVFNNYFGRSETQLEICRSHKRGKPVVTTTFPHAVAIVTGFEEIKEIQNSDNFADRPIGQILRSRSRGIFQNNGRTWKELRKYTMKALGQLGIGRKNQMASILEAERQEMLDHINHLVEKTGNRIPVQDLFANSVINVVWSIAAGEKFSRDDPKYIQLLHNTSTLTHVPVYKIISMEFKPIQYLVHTFPSLLGLSELFDAFENIGNYFKDIVEARKDLGQYKTNEADDFIDRFLKEIDNFKYSANEDIFCVDELLAILIDLFQAGMDTTSHALECAVMWMIKYPLVQSKVQDEIDGVIGNNIFPSYADHRQNMPYTSATILEVHRMSNIVPFGARMSKENCVVGGVQIEKNSFVFPFFHCVRMDEEFWGDPKVFRPERFLDSENNFIQENVNHLMTFGGGVRVCPGELVANWTTFVFFVGMLQRYNLSKSDEDEPIRMTDCAAITNRVIPFHFTATIR